MDSEKRNSSTAPGLRRVLGLSDLILYGIILIMPIAPVPLFVLAQKLSGGHAVTTLLLAMIAMTLTAFSYGRMAALYPSAGSAYTYVARGLNPHLGFLAGWAMILDYLLVPVICTIYGALTLQRLIPATSYWLWVFLLAISMTAVNLLGVRATARTNLVLMIVMSVVVLWFIAMAIRFLILGDGVAGLFSLKPFYDPATFRLSAIIGGTSLAALTYGGFDGVTTLAEEVRDPRRNIMLATVLVCLFTGLFGGLQIYLAQMVWPDYKSFRDLETAFLDVSVKVGGAALFQAMAAILIVANLGAGLSAQAGVSRLLFGMGRDNVLPRPIFGYIQPARRIPSYNILIIGVLMLAGALVLNYERAAEVINFGAFLAFMGVNAAAMRESGVRSWREAGRLRWAVIVPLCGFAFCAAIWLGPPTPAKVIGGVWFAAGLIYNAVRTRGFRTAPVPIDLSEA
jgi:putrescine importer